MHWNIYNNFQAAEIEQKSVHETGVLGDLA